MQAESTDAPVIEPPHEAPPAASPSTSPAQAAPERPAWGLLQSDRLFLIVLSSAILLLILLNLMILSWKRTPAFEIDRLPHRDSLFQIDINKATWVEWMQLPEIGETLARQVVADREQNGPFPAVEAVRRVKGIGEVKMKAILPHLKIVPDTDSPPAPAAARD